MRKQAIVWLIMIAVTIPLVAVMGLIFLVLSGSSNFLSELYGGTKQLESSEIRGYEGKDLSSIDDFEENSIKGPQYVDKTTYRLRVTGLVKQPLEYGYDAIVEQDLKERIFRPYRKVVTLDCVEGWDVTIMWEGIRINDLFDHAKPQPEAKTVIFHAVDGYTTSFPVSYFKDNDILIAYKMNGAVLPPEQGFPFYLVAESKWGYKWIKWIDSIEFSADENYQGYWEQRGYSNSGDLDQPFLNP